MEPVSQQTGDTEFWKQLVTLHLSESRLDQAWAAFALVQELSPEDSGTHYIKGILLQLSGRLDEALAAYAEAIHLGTRSSPEPYPRNSKALSAAAAMQMCDTAAGNYPGARQAQAEGMFDCQHELQILEGRLLAWEADLRSTGRALNGEHARKFGGAWYNLGCAALAAYTQDDRRIHLFQKAFELNPEDVLSRLNRVFAMNYSYSASSGEIFTAHRETGQWLESRCAQAIDFSRALRNPDQRLRIAYLSSDFREHSVAHFILPVLEHHDRGKFEVCLYYNHSRVDDYTRKARQFADRFSQVNHLSDQSLCEAIKADKIDILIDLNGLTEHNRLPVLAMRAAPVQVSWLGYPNTTGLKTIDYRIVDEITDPPPQSQDFNLEKLLYLPRSFSVYQPPANIPGVAQAPCLESGHVTFGSFNSPPKLNEPLLQTWCNILQRVPAARILLKNTAFGYAEPRRQLLERFAREAVDPERVELMGDTPRKREHLQSYSLVDITLDSFPYNGTTTTCDSLIMGVPVVTRAGTEHRSRVGASLLAAVQLDSLVGRDDNAYMDIATRLGTDLDLLLSLRSGLRERVQASSLMDAGALTRELELKLEQVWASWCQQE